MSSNNEAIIMTDKEKADCLIELHKTQMEHFMQTREIELKVNIALWTLLAGTGAAFLYRDISLPQNYCKISSFIVICHFLLWMLPIQFSEDTDNHFIKPLVLVLEAEGSKRKMDIATFIHLNAIPFNQNVEHCHRKCQTALEISPFSVHNLLEVIN
jgi:hypothetical protein